MFDGAIEKSPMYAFHMLQRHTHILISLIPASRKEDTKDFDRVKRCLALLGNTPHITLNIKIDLRKCIAQT